MATNEIHITNLGPIEQLTIKLEGPGVTVISAPNGAGKSIALDALQGLASGRGKLPLRDGAERGSIDGWGMHATINPKQTRVAGEFALENIEGKLDLGSFVNPGVQDPVAADKRRIRSLVGFLGLEADAKLFSQHESFNADEFELLVQQDTYACTDLVDMASKIARDYHAEARVCERAAHDELAKATSIAEQINAIDMTAESDPEILQQQFMAAQQEYSRGVQRARVQEEKRAAADKARNELVHWDTQDVPTVTDAQLQLDAELRRQATENQRVADIETAIAKLQADLEVAQNRATIAGAHVGAQRTKVQLAERHAERREDCLAIIADGDSYEAPNAAQLEELRDAFHASQEGMARGVRVRDAKLLETSRALYRESSEARAAKAEHLRQCAATTDSVLCSLINTQVFRVESVGVNKRLQTYHADRDAWVFYHDLSEAEKWTRAIDEGVNRVGDGGLLFICQEAWEGMDVWNRQNVHEHGVSRNVYMLTLEATRNAADGREFKVSLFEAA